MKKHSSRTRDYTLHFGSVMNSNGNIQVIDHVRDKESNVGLTVDDSGLRCRVQQQFPSIIADLIDLAVAIHATDRLVIQNLRQEQTRICVVLPVRHPELLSKNAFQYQLSDLLQWATGSRWLFEFCKRLESGRIIEQQPLLSSADSHVDEVTLWSGGLDALAGLYTRLKASPDKSFMLFGTGSNDNTYSRQEQVFKVLQNSFSNRLNLCRVPIRFFDSNLLQKNKISRARGIVFTFLGVACAYLMDQNGLHLYENGIGAINLPYRKSSVGLDHTRSVHPLTLLMVSDIISELLGKRIRVKNPFLLWTKAEMCKTLAENRRHDLLPLTMSCDSPHRQHPIQCGYCSSCILRKQALAASRMEDRTHYIVPHGKPPSGNTALYLQHMLTQVSTLRGLLNVSKAPNSKWESFAHRFPELDDIVDRTAQTEDLLPTDMQKHLTRLYQTYIAEWDALESQVSVHLLDERSNQQTSDDC